MCITASFESIIGGRASNAAAERPVRLQVGWEKAGEGNPCEPAQARMQVSIHAQSGGAPVGPPRARSNPNALSDSTWVHNTPEFGRNAGVPDGFRAAETAVVHLCLAKAATVDTTRKPKAMAARQIEILI